ncbi:MAG: hypothetical protein KDF60_12815 [Calditrichaeota bacterium]|nr:hypothetical protein [Calditrichota bacterium]
MKQNITILFQRMIMVILLVALQQTHLSAQVGKEIKWLRMGMLHHYLLNYGAEIEDGRTGRVTEQTDGLRWPAQFANQDVSIAKAMWIGCTDYPDRNGETYSKKVIVAGPRQVDAQYQFIPSEFKMIGRIAHPLVYVDGVLATDNDLNDVVDEYDENLFCDRLIVNKLVTYLGIEVTRKIMQFSQQYNDNYIIYDYVFKNTGVVDLDGNTDSKTLNGVYFYFLYRYGGGWDAFVNNYAPINSISWGRNTMNQVVGIGPNAASFPHRAQYSWYGLNSSSRVNDWGGPDPNSGRLSAIHYVGSVILHADTSPQNTADNREQPRTTMFIGSDSRPQTFGSDQYTPATMNARYDAMAAGHPDVTHADQVGEGFADQYGTDPGGYSQGQGFGPYTLAPGDSIHLVIAEGVAGIDRLKTQEVGRKWYLWQSNTSQPELVLPDGSTTTNHNEYKKQWVKTGEDSLLKTFNSAVENYNSGYGIPKAPPPPDLFEVKSGGDRIILSWSNSAESYPYFDGYELYRAVGKPDTLFTKIFSCDASDVVNRYEDKNAIRGLDYYYYIVTKDDGSQNTRAAGIPLKSNLFYTVTNEPAFLRKPAVLSTMDSIRVVPNPYNIRANSLQFGTDAPDRIGFYGLPPECTIKIYTERGDLIDTIIHDDGTADELWDSLTKNRQFIVSGVYIAYFEVPRNFYSAEDGKLLFRKGDKKIRKFFIIR